MGPSEAQLRLQAWLRKDKDGGIISPRGTDAASRTTEAGREFLYVSSESELSPATAIGEPGSPPVSPVVQEGLPGSPLDAKLDDIVEGMKRDRAASIERAAQAERGPGQ